jgi:glycine cleavage system H protein
LAENPADLRYTAEHEWVRSGAAGSDVVRIGITDFAQGQLGDVVYVDLPALGKAVIAGTTCGEIESTKSVSEIYAPVTGTVVGRNDELDAAPDQVNVDPYGAGWLLDIQVADPASVDGLLTAAEYSALNDQ